MIPVRIFISSVQSEFAQERVALRDHIYGNAWLRRLFKVFLFEDVPASNQRPDTLYLDEVARCDIYVGLFGLRYGSEDEEGVSPTEREFNCATELGKVRLIYLRRISDEGRDPRMSKLVAKAEKEIVRKSFEKVDDLKRLLSDSLAEYYFSNLISDSIANENCRTSAEAEEVLEHYTETFYRTYTLPEPLVPFNCLLDEGEIPSGDVASLISEERTDILLHGPSGCGKTRLAADIALDFSRHMGVTITIPVRNYVNGLSAILDHEAYLMNTSSAIRLLSAAQNLHRPILLIVDGYNECCKAVRESLTLELVAWARRYTARLLITSQIPLARQDLLTLRRIKVPRPLTETKVAIAKNAMGVDVFPKDMEQLLGAISTGLEAKLVGEVGNQLSPGSSRYALFDAFVRKRLGDRASDSIRVLSQIAVRLSDRIAFSLSVRDLDRLMDEKHVPHDLSKLLQKKGLLTLRGERISFAHEMFFDVFAAEAVVRRAAGRAESVLAALATPQHGARKDFIIGAIDDDLFIEQLLEVLEDPQSVTACLDGSCGIRAQDWAESRCLILIKRFQEEASNVRFRICEQRWGKVGFQNRFLTTYNSAEQAFLSAFPKLISEGRYLEDILNIIGVLDQRIADDGIRLRDEAQGRNIALRSGLFANSYVFQTSTAPGITWICSQISTGFFSGTTSNTTSRIIEKHLGAGDLSPGQLYLLLTLSRSDGISAPFIIRAIKMHWTGAPYHLRLALMHAAVACQRTNESDRTALIETIEALPEPRDLFTSSSIADTLRMLGAFEDSERDHYTIIGQEVKQCLSDPNEDDSCSMAYRVYSAQFDHPFSGAYYEIVSDLPDQERKTLLMMAAKGASDSSFFLKSLLIDLVSFEDPNVGESIVRWTALPPINAFMPQESIAVFVVAHVALARLGCPLPDKQLTADNPAAEALAACGTILYWSNCTDIDESTKRDTCHHSLSVLARHELGAALNVIRECDHAGIQCRRFLSADWPVEWSIVGCFPTEIAEVCRHALIQPLGQIGYFRDIFDFHKHQDLMFAVNVLAQHGKKADRPLLRHYAEDRNLGTQAIEAMKMIEDRFTAS